jgi:hypothetical protein
MPAGGRHAPMLPMRRTEDYAPGREMFVGGSNMKNRRLIRGSIGVFAVVACAPAALGDSPCYAGYRDTTPAERTKMTSVLETIKSALPAPPTGWVLMSDDVISVPQGLCQDFAKVPLDYSFSRNYRQVGDAEQRNKLMNDQAAIQAEIYKKKQPRLEALQAQMEAVVAKQIPLMQKGDIAGAQKYDAEIQRLQTEYQNLADEGIDPAAMAAAGKAMNRDLELTIRVYVNPMTARTPDEAKPTTRPAGSGSAYRWHVEDENSSNDHALYYFGTWFKRPDGSFQPSVRQGAPFSAAHALSIEVTGYPDRVTETVAAIDFAKVASVVR